MKKRNTTQKNESIEYGVQKDAGNHISGRRGIQERRSIYSSRTKPKINIDELKGTLNVEHKEDTQSNKEE